MRLLEAANAAASRRAELRADTEEAAVVGTDAAVEGLRVLLVSDVIDRAVNRAAVDPRRPDIAEEIRLRVAALDDRDHETAAREAGESSRVDRTHPPTLERIRLQQSLPPSPPSIVLSPERIAALDAGLRPFLDAALRRRADWYR